MRLRRWLEPRAPSTAALEPPLVCLPGTSSQGSEVDVDLVRFSRLWPLLGGGSCRIWPLIAPPKKDHEIDHQSSVSSLKDLEPQ